LSSNPQPRRESSQGILVWLAGLAKAIAFPFDRVLSNLASAGLCFEALCCLLGLTRDTLDEHIVRLGLSSPRDKPFRKPSASGWSIEDMQRLIAWRTAGVHPDVIGQSLSRHRSANAVRAKARRLGLLPPPRANLFRPNPASLAGQRPEFEFAVSGASPEANCGRSAGPVAVPSVDAGEPAAAPGTSATRGERNPRQRELASFDIVGGSERHSAIVVDLQPIEAAATEPPAIEPAPRPPTPMPRSRDEVDFSNLKWVGSLKQPLTNELAVYVVGMLFMGGLHWLAVAEKVGKSPGALKTWRTRMRIPVDPDRKKIRCEFDEEVAFATMQRSGYVIRAGLLAEWQQSPEYFWVLRTDRATRLSPVRCKRDRMIERRSPMMEIVTREQLDAEARTKTRPFAADAIRIGAMMNSSEFAHAQSASGRRTTAF
jgi:hypothetical protein